MESTKAGIRLAAVLFALCLAGCSLHYVQGVDHQVLDLEILRPINSHNTAETSK